MFICYSYFYARVLKKVHNLISFNFQFEKSFFIFISKKSFIIIHH